MNGRDGASTWKSPVCPQHNGFGLDSRPEQELVAVVKNQEHAKDAKNVFSKWHTSLRESNMNPNLRSSVDSFSR